jgi:hypothetical protein
MHHEIPAFGSADQAADGGLPLFKVPVALRQLHDVVGGILEGEQLAPLGSGIGSSKRRDQPFSGFAALNGAHPSSGEQVHAGLSELHIDTGFMPDQPSAGDGARYAHTVFVWTASGAQKRLIDQLDRNPPVSIGFGCIREFQQLARSLIGVGERLVGGVLHA